MVPDVAATMMMSEAAGEPRESTTLMPAWQPPPAAPDVAETVAIDHNAQPAHHARLERRGDQFWLVDLGSTNGTLVNGEPVQEKELTHGDRITIGQNAVHFSVIGS